MNSKYTNKNGVKLLATVMVLAMAFAGCFFVIGDSQSDAAVSDDTTYIKGTLNASQTYGSGVKVVVDGNLTIPSGSILTINGATLTIKEGVTVTIAAGGILDINKNSTVIIDGSIVAKTGDSASTIKNSTVMNATNGQGVYLNGSIVLERKATIVHSSVDGSGNPEVGEIVFNEGSSFSMQSAKTMESTISNQKLSIKDGAVVNINGIVDSVTISALGSGIHTYGSITLAKAAGAGILKMSFTTVEERIPLAFDGATATDVKDATNFVIVVSGEISANYTMTVLKTDAKGATTSLNYPVADNSSGSSVQMKGIVRIAEDSTFSVQAGASFVTEADSNLEVDGTLSAVGKSGTVAIFTLGGETYVAGKIDVGSFVTTTLTGSYVIIEGDGNVSVNYTSSAPTCYYYGASFSVEATAVKTFYIMGLSQAIDAAVTAGVTDVSISSTVAASTILGKDIVLTKDLTIPAVLSVEVITGSKVIVSEGVELIFESGSTVALTGIVEVKGALIDYNTMIYASGKIIADVRSVDADYTYFTYTTLATALEGDEKEIEIYSNVSIVGNMVIPEEYTVDVASTKVITVQQDSVLTVNGKLILGASTCLVKGSVTSPHVNGAVFVNGEVSSSVDIVSLNDFVFGAYWHENGTAVVKKITSVENAAENSSDIKKITVYGDLNVGNIVFTEGDSSLSVNIANKFSASSIKMNGGTLSINATSESTIGVVDLVDANVTVVGSGKLTAKIVASQGTDEESSVSVKKAVVTVVSTVSEVEGVEKCDLSITAIGGGSVSIDAGKVTIPTVAVASGAEVSVSAGSELIIAQGEAVTFVGDANIVIDGTLTIDGSITIGSSVTTTPILNGKIVVSDKATTVSIYSMQILGSVEISDGKVVTVTGSRVTIGNIVGTGDMAASVVGKIDLPATGYLKVYSSSDISKMVVDGTNYTTEYFVNGSLFATVYTESTTQVFDIISVEEINHLPGIEPVTAVGWTTEFGSPITAGSYVKDYAQAYMSVPYQKIDVIFSIENGTQLKIGAYFYDATTTEAVKYATGTYAVSAKALAGFEGTAIVELWVDGVNLGVQDGTVTLDLTMVGKDVVIVSTFGTAPGPEPTPVDPSKEVIVSTSVVDGKVIVSVISLDGGYLVAGTEVTVTFTTLVETTAFGQTVYKPTPVTETITIGDDKPTISNNAYELADILGDKYAVINVVSTIGTTGYGSMSLNYKG